MPGIDIIQLAIYSLAIIFFIKPLGKYIANVYQGSENFLSKILLPSERLLYKICGLNPEQEMTWKQYLAAMLFFNMLSIIFLYLLQRLQAYLPLNPQNFSALPPELAFNTASSIVTNTGWQAYAGEAAFGYCVQTLGLTVQFFISAATGMALMVAFIRSIIRHQIEDLGNFWVDTVRGILYILLPLAMVLALILAYQGVVQNFSSYKPVENLDLASSAQVVLPMGPVASFVAIKQLSSTGAGFMNTNSAHPYENPNALSNFLEIIAILIIPAALCYTFGVMVNDSRQGKAILLAMLLIFLLSAWLTINAEYKGNPAFIIAGTGSSANMEGKEQRLGIFGSSLYAVATTATGNGAVNCMHDSLMPMSAAVTLSLMHLGEIIFGGVGCGLYGMLLLVMITVFISGLMIGRTPEYLGKKLEPFEMKMLTFCVLIMPLASLVMTAIACLTKSGTEGLLNTGAHGFSEILYAFTSMRANNGSSFAGLNANNAFYNISGGMIMLASRYWQAIAVLAIAGAFAKKKIAPVTSVSLATHNTLFILLLISVIMVLGLLSFLPTIALGPIVEYITIKGSI